MMAEPTKKSPEMENFITKTLGINRKRIIEDNTCVICKTEVDLDGFKDALSAKEYVISGLCQKCQDETFG